MVKSPVIDQCVSSSDLFDDDKSQDPTPQMDSRFRFTKFHGLAVHSDEKAQTLN